MLVHRRINPSIKLAGIYLYTWVERGTVRVRCLAQEHNTMTPVRARTRTARSGVERTNHDATAPPRLTQKGKNIFRKSTALQLTDRWMTSSMTYICIQVIPLIPSKFKAMKYITLLFPIVSSRHLWSILFYIITQVILAIWLVLAYDLLEDRRTTDVIISKFFLLCFKMAESFENLHNILHDWQKIRYKKVLSRHWTGTRSIV